MRDVFNKTATRSIHRTYTYGELVVTIRETDASTYLTLTSAAPHAASFTTDPLWLPRREEPAARHTDVQKIIAAAQKKEERLKTNAAREQQMPAHGVRRIFY